MSDQEALGLISQLGNDRWRSLLVPLLDADESVRAAAYEELYSALQVRQTEANPLWPNDPDALRLIEIGMIVRFPHEHHWRNPANELLFWFVTIQWPPLVGKIAEHFAAADDSARLDAMTILAAQHTEEAMRTLGPLIERYGMPPKMYQRLFLELNESCEWADHVLPQLVLRAGRYMPAVMDFLNVAHQRGTLTHSKLAPALPLVEEQATFEAFAASHMAEWLRYPMELDREPERLELAATVRGANDDGERQWCLWKFTGDKGVEYAGVSGPYPLPAPVGPLEGSDVFSNFAEWDSATPEQHLESVLETLRDSRVHRAREDS